MANSVVIPRDIIDYIIEIVGDDCDLLKKCALVSSSFLLPSRKHLFSKIFLGNDQDCKRIHRFLVENPVIQSFIRSIVIAGYETFQSHSLIAILRLLFYCLESFTIYNWWNPLNWDDFSNELKDALSTIIHLSTLKTLCLKGVSAPSMLFDGIHLTKLQLDSFWLNNFDSEQSRLLTLGASESEGVTSHTVVDQCVWNHHMLVDVPTEPIFLPFMRHLRAFEIFVKPNSASMSDFDILSFLMRSLRASLTSPATLEYIKFRIIFEENDNHFNYYAFFDDLRDADVWRHLDSIITHPTGSRLQRVDINIRYCFRYDDDVSEPDKTEVMQPVLDALPLLREKGILFVEANVLG